MIRSLFGFLIVVTALVAMACADSVPSTSPSDSVAFLDHPAYEAIVTTAGELGMRVGGHIPIGLALDEILDGGQILIAHSEELLKPAQGDFSSANIDRLARSIAVSGTWVTPTLSTSRNILAVLDDAAACLPGRNRAGRDGRGR